MIEFMNWDVLAEMPQRVLFIYFLSRVGPNRCAKGSHNLFEKSKFDISMSDCGCIAWGTVLVKSC